MARPINPDRTGPGICKNCGEFRVRVGKGLCRPCYDRQRPADPLASAGLQQKAIDSGPVRLVQIQRISKKLRDDQLLTSFEYVAIHQACQDALDRLREITASDIQQEADAAMAELELESREAQPQQEAEPDQVEVVLENIQPNPVEVEEPKRQPQPEGKDEGDKTDEDDEPNVA